LFPPLLASLAELAVVWLWHTPILHSAASESVQFLVAEQAAFLLSGMYLWLSVLGGDVECMNSRRAAGIVALLLTAMHMTLLGALLALSPRPLYAHMHGFSGLTPIEDQHLGGAIMLIIGGVSYLVGGLWLATGLLSLSKKPA
jgi:putative membrane protein